MKKRRNTIVTARGERGNIWQKGGKHSINSLIPSEHCFEITFNDTTAGGEVRAPSGTF